MTSSADSSDPFDRLEHEMLAIEELEALADPMDVSRFLDEHASIRDTLESVLQSEAGVPDSELVIGDYRIVREIGRGGMGTVYEARQISLDRRVALKLLARELTHYPTAAARFRREATLAAGLDHPSIARVFGFTADANGQYLVMELVDGAPLDRVLGQVQEADPGLSAAGLRRAVVANRLDTKTPVDETAARAAIWSGTYEQAIALLIAQLAEALDHAHSLGVIHRDVKPGNVLIRAGGVAVLTDFGLARETGQIGVTLTGESAGTPAYQSPEQIEGRSQELGPATDVFSLGVTLYEALTLRRPFFGETILEVQRQILHNEPHDPARANAHIDRDLCAILAKSLEKNRRHRYRSAGALAQDLHDWRAGRPVSARRISRIVRAKRWCQRNPLAASFVGVLIVAVVGLGVLLAWSLGLLRDLDERTGGVRAESLVRAYEEGLLPPPSPGNLDLLASLADEAKALARHGAVLRQRLADPALEQTELRYAYEALLRDRDNFDLVAERVLPGLRRRLAFSERALEAVASKPDPKWREAADDVRADPRFEGFYLRPQLGLVPLRRDEKSGLWEFWHIHSGDAPETDATGALRIEPTTGMVFVLLPPGEFRMGRQKVDPALPNFDEGTGSGEGPVHPVRLERPFFLSKYEMSRGQWRTLGATLRFDSEYYGFEGMPGHDRDEACFPVQGQTWFEITRLLRSWGLTLPTEAQWEYACRAGTDSPWSSGSSEEDLVRIANIRDATLAANPEYNPVKGPAYSKASDGYAATAPVDAMQPNPFGLHQMHGNVAEQCLDRFERGYAPEAGTRPGDWRAIDSGQ